MEIHPRQIFSQHRIPTYITKKIQKSGDNETITFNIIKMISIKCPAQSPSQDSCSGNRIKGADWIFLARPSSSQKET
jgi:hypothetical protein